ncbi:hypothetical protein [Chengkuizengella axinellae]|uniref:Uncharacterized protein n=1 Tax=Chengkuizengella axinellae TaxID=3064388 RepID=A0ABT9J029_9BACL|nr:hypothetical protein [Chengkuizengella sp. 2205SS18-9]MDP5274973.1 hypothetical protein [Chengkuizengella sp. 2205SS18-9]
MGLDKGPFVEGVSVSVDDPYGGTDSINLNNGTVDVLILEVCVKDPEKTQVSIDSMAQIAVENGATGPTTFEVLYEVLANGVTLGSINDLMDYEAVVANSGQHNNFPNFPLLDENPIAGINTYILRCTEVQGPSVFVGSRSLTATVFTV